MDRPGSGYGDTHRAFLQAFMSRGTLTMEEAKPILAAIFSVDGELIPMASFFRHH